MEVTVIETNKGHKSILCEGFRYRLDVETKSGALLDYFSFALLGCHFAQISSAVYLIKYLSYLVSIV